MKRVCLPNEYTYCSGTKRGNHILHVHVSHRQFPEFWSSWHYQNSCGCPEMDTKEKFYAASNKEQNEDCRLPHYHLIKKKNATQRTHLSYYATQHDISALNRGWSV